jgi:hypothetical protein
VPSNEVERRLALRYAVSANVLFSWEERGAYTKGEGVTRDMSTNGLFVYSNILPPESAPVRIEVVFPPLLEPGMPVRIKVRGRVTRVERELAGTFESGFAVSSVSTSLLSHEDSGTCEGTG